MLESRHLFVDLVSVGFLSLPSSRFVQIATLSHLALVVAPAFISARWSSAVPSGEHFAVNSGDQGFKGFKDFHAWAAAHFATSPLCFANYPDSSSSSPAWIMDRTPRVQICCRSAESINTTMDSVLHYLPAAGGTFWEWAFIYPIE